MPDFQDVDGPDDRPLLQELLHRSLGISGKQRAEGPKSEDADYRGVIDVARQQRGGRVSRARVPDLERRARIEGESPSCTGEEVPRSGFGSGGLQELVVCRVGVGTPAVQDGRDAKPFQHRGKTADMILVGMGEDDHVDRPMPPGQLCAELTQRLVGVRAGIDQHRPAFGRQDQDAVSLADVEHEQVQAAVRQARERGHRQDPDHRHQRAPWSAETAQQRA